MFLGGMGGPAEGQPDYPEGDEARMKRVENKLDQIAAKQGQPEQGKPDYYDNYQDNTGQPAAIERDFYQFNPTEGPNYGTAEPTGSEKKQQIEDTAKTREAIEEVRDKIEEISDEKKEYAEAEENIFDIAA